MTGLGYIQGDWKVYRDRTQQINLIEPVLEGVMQLFFQSVILYIVYGPGTSRIGSTFHKTKYFRLNLSDEAS